VSWISRVISIVAQIRIGWLEPVVAHGFSFPFSVVHGSAVLVRTSYVAAFKTMSLIVSAVVMLNAIVLTSFVASYISYG